MAASDDYIETAPSEVHPSEMVVKVNVLHLVLSAVICSLLFGMNLSLLNISLGIIDSDLNFCGDSQFDHYHDITPALCAMDDTCRRECAVFSRKPPETIFPMIDARADLIAELEHVAAAAASEQGNLSYRLRRLQPDPEDGKTIHDLAANVGMVPLDDEVLVVSIRCPGGPNDIACDTARRNNAAVQSALLIGAMLGAAAASRLVPYGRRQSLIYSLYIIVLGIILSVVTTNAGTLILGRFISGIAVGLISTVVPYYISEISPAQRRGSYGVLHQLSIVSGIVLATFLGLIFEDPAAQDDNWVLSKFQRFWWRFLLISGIGPVIVALYLFLRHYTFETPTWYALQGDFINAKLTLLKIRTTDEEANSELEALRQRAEGELRTSTFWQTFVRNVPQRKAVIVGCLLSAFQQLTGINIFITSSTDLFRRAGASGHLLAGMTVSMTLLNLILCIPTVYLIERCGRKLLLLLGVLGQLLSILPATILYHMEKDPEIPSRTCQVAAIGGAFFFIAFFAAAYGPVLWVYLFEIYIDETRDVASALACAANWFAAAIAVYLGIMLSNKWVYSVVSIANFIAFLIIGASVRETKGLPSGTTPFREGGDFWIHDELPPTVIGTKL